jgi:hypothetical protein
MAGPRKDVSRGLDQRKKLAGGWAKSNVREENSEEPSQLHFKLLIFQLQKFKFLNWEAQNGGRWRELLTRAEVDYSLETPGSRRRAF